MVLTTVLNDPLIFGKSIYLLKQQKVKNIIEEEEEQKIKQQKVKNIIEEEEQKIKQQKVKNLIEEEEEQKIIEEASTCADIEPATNIKCIIFTIFIVGIYWFLPRNKWFLLLLLYVPYLMMAWYDEIYQCKREMGPTYLGTFYAWAKPPNSKQSLVYKNWCPKHKNKVFVVDMIVLVLFLIFFFAFFLKWKPKLN